ncbi:hypothetical protein [Coralloluteibacterium thermophilus]|uniref:Uncharacterized protein n=1 Tax=Coralloluteibacterium thermophilum TaxID=2707049 RepID=A0ABV9NHU8_9GAMM
MPRLLIAATLAALLGALCMVGVYHLTLQDTQLRPTPLAWTLLVAGKLFVFAAVAMAMHALRSRRRAAGPGGD